MKVASLVTALLLGTAAVGVAQSPAPAPTPATPGQGQGPRVDGQRQPPMRMAAMALRRAASALERAEHDFGGHRAKALALVKQAEEEMKQAMAWAKEHPEAVKAPGAVR